MAKTNSSQRALVRGRALPEPGDLRLLMHRPDRSDPTEGGFVQLWSESVGRHLDVALGTPALVLTVTEPLTAAPHEIDVADVLVDVPRIGPTVVTTFVDRLLPLVT